MTERPKLPAAAKAAMIAASAACAASPSALYTARADRDRLRSQNRRFEPRARKRHGNFVARSERRLELHARSQIREAHDHPRLRHRRQFSLESVQAGELRQGSRNCRRQPPAIRSRQPPAGEAEQMAMGEGASGVRASVGFASETGPRKQNEDFAAAVIGAELPDPRREVVAAIADGIGGAKGGRVAAEIAVRGFLDGFWDLPETVEVRRAAARIINSLNTWIHALGRQDTELAGMGCTFTALVLRGRVAHLLHVGDTRCYRLRRDVLSRLS